MLHILFRTFFDLLDWLLQQRALTLLAIATTLLGSGFCLQVAQNERNVERVAAIQAGPPAAIEITKFAEDRDMTDEGEVVIRAQPVIEYGYRFTYSEIIGDDYAFMVPLISTDATNDKVVSGIAFYHSDSSSFENITPELMLNGVTGFGDFGPIVELNGSIEPLGKWQNMMTEAFAEQGLLMRANPVIVWPFLEGREAALVPSDVAIFKFMSYLAATICLLALGKLVFGSNAEPTSNTKATALSPDRSAPVFEPIPPKNAFDTAPLWKQRAGLLPEGVMEAHEESKEPRLEVLGSTIAKPVRHSAKSTPAIAPLTAPKRTGIGLRKVLIVIVGGLFLLGLASTVSDLIGKSSAFEVVELQTIEEAAAQSAAAAIVPDADPNRHWTDIDVSFIAEWFEAKWLLAASGDVDAMMILGMIGFMATILPIGINLYFQSHRRRLRPKISTGMDAFS